MKKNFQDISKQAFYQSNKPQNYYHRPLPTYPTKPNEFDKLIYVASSIFNSKPKNSFNHAADVSLFRSIVFGKK